MGACCSRASDASDVLSHDDDFGDARSDAFDIAWEDVLVTDGTMRERWESAKSASSRSRADDAERLAAFGELEAALWTLERAGGVGEGASEEDEGERRAEAADPRAAAWRDVYEQAIALNDIELEEHHEGWKPVGKGARRATHVRRASSVDFDAEVIIGANHSRRPSSVDLGSRRTSSMDFGSRMSRWSDDEGSVKGGRRKTSSVDLGQRKRRGSTGSLDAAALRVAGEKLAAAQEAPRPPPRDPWADVEINVNATDEGDALVIDAGVVRDSRVSGVDDGAPKRPGHRPRETKSGRSSASSSVDLDNDYGALASSQPDAGNQMRETFETNPDLDERLVVYYGRFKGGTVHSVKLSATFDAPPHRLVAIAREWDLLSVWNQYVIETAILVVRGLMHVVVYSAIWLPWPLSARDKIIVIDACFVGQPPSTAVDSLNIPTMKEFESEVPHSCAILLTRTATKGDDVGPGAPKSSSKRKRIDFVGNCGMRMRSLPPLPGSKLPRTRGDIVVHADVRVRFIPASVVRFVLKVMAPWVHRMIDKMLNSPKYFGAPDSLFQPRIDANPELYDVLKRRLGEHEFVSTARAEPLTNVDAPSGLAPPLAPRD